MSDYGSDGVYGEDISDVESVASLLEEERKKEDDEKKNSLYPVVESDTNQKTEKYHFTTEEIFQRFKNCVFQDASNDKLYILKIKKSGGS